MRLLRRGRGERRGEGIIWPKNKTSNLKITYYVNQAKEGTTDDKEFYFVSEYSQLSRKRPPLGHDKVVAYGKDQQNKLNTGLIT